MCGIFCSLRASHDQEENPASEVIVHAQSDKLKRVNATRGPDAQQATSISLPARNGGGNSSGGMHLYLYASELQLRGDAPIVQPHMEDGDVLCWNGEVFEGLKIDPTENDGQKIFRCLRAAAEPLAISEALGNIEGPYAFVFYHVGATADRQYYTHSLQERSKKLYFARDPLGRRSLLIHKPTLINPIFLLSSVSAGSDVYGFEELSTGGIHVLNLDALCGAPNFVTAFHSNLDIVPRASGEHVPFGLVRKVNRSLPPDDLPRIQGIDSISLPIPLVEAMEQLIDQLSRSVMLRVKDIPQAPGDKGNARVAILFSGGIDSAVLAFFAHQHISLNEPIDLLNVAFENPRKMQLQLDGNVPKRKKTQLTTVEVDADADRELSSYMVPDRVTGLQELEELRRLCPGRVWNFVEVDVPYEDSRAAKSVVETAMYPARTVMDFSLALALYFASRGIGRVREASSSGYKTYTSPAKVLLSGLGSDELLGGYSRHRSVFTARGWQGIIDELQLELDRLPTRNLGRDDRIISSHGKETRYPFLSLSVVSFLAGLPVHLKLDPRLDIGIGDKTLLRLAARKVGLVEASMRKKRAMQFGSHSARMEGGEVDKRGDTMIRSSVEE